MKRTVAFLLLVLMLLPAVVSCRLRVPETETTDDVTTEDNTAPTEELPTEKPEPEPDPVYYITREGGSLRILSQNLCGTDVAGQHSIANRIPLFLSLVGNFIPDSIGVQECTAVWAEQLDKQLPHFARAGLSTSGNEVPDGSFSNYVYYNTDRFELVESGTFWLTDNPENVSGNSCVFAMLEDKSTKMRYVHMNAQTSGTQAEIAAQIAVIREEMLRFDELQMPVVLTGDFNTMEGSNAYLALLDEDERIADAKFIAETADNIGTDFQYGANDPEYIRPSDFCFVTSYDVSVSQYRVLSTPVQHKYVSDHFGLFLLLTVEETDDLFTDAVAPDADNCVPELLSAGRHSLTFRFAPAVDDFDVISYRLTVQDIADKVVFDKTISSGFRSGNLPDAYDYTVSNLAADSEYRVMIRAKNVFGAVSEVADNYFRTLDASAVISTGITADLFDLDVENGVPVDLSETAMNIELLGTPIIRTPQDDFMVGFNHTSGENSNLKVTGIADLYDKIGDGFTIEVAFRVNEKPQRSEGIFANKHAGGFGITIGANKKVNFDCHIGGTFRTVSADIELGVWYHVIGMYDGSNLFIYLNGELISSAAVEGKFGLPTHDGAKYLCIGADSDASGKGEYPCNVDINVARLYSDVITDPTIIAKLYDASIR